MPQAAAASPLPRGIDISQVTEEQAQAYGIVSMMISNLVRIACSCPCQNPLWYLIDECVNAIVTLDLEEFEERREVMRKRIWDLVVGNISHMQVSPVGVMLAFDVTKFKMPKDGNNPPALSLVFPSAEVKQLFAPFIEVLKSHPFVAEVK